jgi:LSD1 subclass zinc finger protein
MKPVNCPNCREALEVPFELLGREIRCASCGTVFLAGSAAPPTVRPAAAPRAYRSVERDPAPPKGNRGVWLVLFATFVVAGAITAGCAGLFTWSTNPRMHTATEADGRFKLEMPGQPQPITLPGDNGATVKGFESDRPLSEDRYFVKYFELPEKADRSDPQAILASAIQKEVAATAPGPETARQVTTHDGYPALDAWFETGPALMARTTILRAILIGQRVYLLGAKGPNLQPQMWWVMRFFKSFEVVEGPAPAAKQ